MKGNWNMKNFYKAGKTIGDVMGALASHERHVNASASMNESKVELRLTSHNLKHLKKARKILKKAGADVGRNNRECIKSSGSLNPFSMKVIVDLAQAGKLGDVPDDLAKGKPVEYSIPVSNWE